MCCCHSPSLLLLLSFSSLSLSLDQYHQQSDECANIGHDNRGRRIASNSCHLVQQATWPHSHHSHSTNSSHFPCSPWVAKIHPRIREVCETHQFSQFLFPSLTLNASSSKMVKPPFLLVGRFSLGGATVGPMLACFTLSPCELLNDIFSGSDAVRDSKLPRLVPEPEF